MHPSRMHVTRTLPHLPDRNPTGQRSHLNREHLPSVDRQIRLKTLPGPLHWRTIINEITSWVLGADRSTVRAPVDAPLIITPVILFGEGGSLVTQHFKMSKNKYDTKSKFIILKDT